MRDLPKKDGKIVGDFALGNKLSILELSKEKDKVGDVEAHWYKVKSGNKEGWVFGGFVSEKQVANTEETAAKLAGNYYYTKMNESPGYDTTVIKLKQNKFTKYVFASSHGLIEEVQGNVYYQAESIELEELTRKIRPERYILYPNTPEESNAYTSAYREFSEDSSHLREISTFKPKKDTTKYFVLNCSDKLYLSDVKTDCTNAKMVYLKKN